MFFFAAVYNLSKTQFFSKQSMVDADTLASEEKYQIFWSSISECGTMSGKASRDVAVAACNCGVRPLWMEIQNAFDYTCHKLFIEEFLQIMLDDDKNA
jgi:hypothetical protein